MNDLKKNFSNLIEIIFQSFSARLIFLISSIISAIVTYRFLSIEQRGLLSVLLALHSISFGLSFYAGSVVQSKVAMLSKKNNFKDLKIYLWCVYLFRIVTIIFISIFIFILSHYLITVIPEIKNASYIKIVAILLLFKTIEGPFNENALFGLSYLKSITIYYFFKSTSLILSLSSLLFFDLNSIYYLIIFLVLDSIFTSSYLWLSYLKWSKKFKVYFKPFAFDYLLVIKNYFFIGYPIWIMSLLFICSSNISILIIAKYLSLKDTAIYSLLIALNMMIFSFPARYESYALTLLSKTKIDNIKNFNKYVYNQFIIFLIITFIFFYFWLTFSDLILNIAFGSKYDELSNFVFFIALFIPFRSMTFFRHIFYIYEKNMLILLITLGRYFLEFFLYFTLIPKMGIQGAILSLVITYFFYGFLVFLISNYNFLNFNFYYFIRLILSIFVFTGFIIIFILINQYFYDASIVMILSLILLPTFLFFQNLISPLYGKKSIFQ